MITYLLLSKDSKSCYALDITWENGRTCCCMNVDNIATGMTIDEVRANNSMIREQVEGILCPVSVIETTIYFGGHAYFIQDGTIYQDNKQFMGSWFKLGYMLNDWMEKRPFTITSTRNGNMFRLQTADAYEIKAAKRICINGSFYETIDFDLAKSLPCYDKFTTFPIPENDGRFIPYCHNRVELLRVLHNINNYEDVDMRDCKFENGKWEITERVLSRLYERVTGSSEVSNVEDIKKVIRFLDNV